MVTCKKCGGENRDEAKYCMHCGAELRGGEAVREMAEQEGASEIMGEPAGEQIVMPSEALADVGAVEREIEFAALPEGALVNERKYELRRILRETDELNIYEALSIEQSKRCPSCGHLANPEDNFCENCGASVEDVAASRIAFTIIEAPVVSKTVLDGLVEVCESSEGTLPQAVEQFSYKPYEGSERSYLVLERCEGQRLSEVDISAARLNMVLEVALGLLKLVEVLGKHSYRVPELTKRTVVKDGGVVLSEFEALQETETCKEAISDMLSQALGWLIEVLQRISETKPSPVELSIAQKLREGIESVERIECIGEMRDLIEAALKELVGAVAIEYNSAGATDIGKVRELNEDGFIIWELTGFQHPSSFHIGLYAVADGMGGHQAGEVACKLALNALLESIQKAVLNELTKGAEQLYEVDWSNVLKDAFEQANSVVYESAINLRSDMGTTMVAAFVVGNRAYIANVGDSRAYIFRGELKQVTKDHSLVQQLVDMGQLTQEEARFHPQRNIIYRAIGLRQQVEVDLFEELLSTGDKLLLCSDGLCDMVNDGEIESVLLSEHDLHSACAELIKRANESGGADNITAVLVEVRRKRTGE